MLVIKMLPPPSPPNASDASIRATDNDAAVARLSAVKKGYLEDTFIKHLIPRAHLQPPRPPLINIGTYVRTAAIDALVEQWLDLSEKTSQTCQIVSLGAGSDTRFWRIAVCRYRKHIPSYLPRFREAGKQSSHLRTYVEVDFPEITTKKAMAIKKNKELLSTLGDASQISLGIYGA